MVPTSTVKVANNPSISGPASPVSACGTAGSAPSMTQLQGNGWMKCLVALGLVATLFGANADAAQPPFDSKLKAFLQGYARSTPLPADQTQ